MRGGRRWSALALGLALGLGMAAGVEAAPKPEPAPYDLLSALLEKRYGAPVEVLVDRDAAQGDDYDINRVVTRPSPGVMMQVVDNRVWPKTFTVPRRVPLGIEVPWPLNGGKRCHAVLEVNGASRAFGVNGDPVHPTPRANGGLAYLVSRMEQIGFDVASFTLPFSDDDSSNPSFQLVGRKSDTKEFRSLPPCPNSTVVRRSDITAVDWQAHFRAYPANGRWSKAPDCIRKELARLGAPINGLLPDGAPAQRTISPISWRGRAVIESCRRWTTRGVDFPCRLRNEDTRCQVLWLRSESDGRPLDLTSMTDFLTSNPQNRIHRGLDESEPAKVQRARIEAEQAQRRKQEAERRAAEIEARRRWEASPEGRAALAAKAERQRQAEAQRARDFPYYVVIRCGDLSHIMITVCLHDDVDTTLRLRNGGTETLYNLSRILGLQPGWETRDGYRIDLRASYALSIQNASSQIMGVRIYERRSGRQVFAREVGRFGTVFTAR